VSQGYSSGGPSVDTDGTLAANSDLLIPSQKAVKTYVDSVSTGSITSLTGEVTATGPGATAATIANGAVSYAKLGADAISAFAVASKGVTNGDTHDHSGGDGAQIAYASLSGTPTIYNQTVEDEGTPVTQRGSVNFVGAGVTVTDSGGKTQVSIPGGSGEAFPVGAVFISVVSTNPSTLLGYGTWASFGAGRVLVGFDSGDSDFDAAEKTGGAKTKAISAHSGTAVADHASHTHTYTDVVNHTHAITITDPGHTHTAAVFATDANGSNFDRSAGGGAQGTATTDSSTTGITASSADPAGGVATGTTAGPSATLTHSVTQPSAHTDLNVVQPYIAVYMWKRTA
jgi:hypothetical protein